MRLILWVADPLHKLTRYHRAIGYSLLTIWFGRLTLWYAIENKWGKA